MLFIAHTLPKNLQVGEIVRIRAGTLSAVGAPHYARMSGLRQDKEGGGLMGEYSGVREGGQFCAPPTTAMDRVPGGVMLGLLNWGNAGNGGWQHE